LLCQELYIGHVLLFLSEPVIAICFQIVDEMIRIVIDFASIQVRMKNGVG